MKKFLFSLLLLLQLLSFKSFAQPGYRDLSFGNGGKANGIFPGMDSYGYAVLQQSGNGKIIVAGSYETPGFSEYMFVARYNVDGTIDSSFGTGGFLVDSITNSNISSAWGLTEQADGKIIVTGRFEYPSYNSFIIRFDSSGIVDTTFGYNGRVIFDNNGHEDQSLCIKVQPDGKILICGTTTDTTTYNQNLLLVRFNNDGSRDSTFGINGVVEDDFGQDDDAGISIAVQADGKIVVGGLTTASSSYIDALIVRYKTDGSRDNSLSGNGYFTFDYAGDDDGFRGIALQPDGKIIAAGASWDANGIENGLLVRLDTSGTLDAGFGTGGVVLESYSFDDIEYVSLMLQPDGKIITAGFRGTLQYDITLSRYLSTGMLDVSFGSGGRITDQVSQDDDEIDGAILQIDNKIVLVGNSATGSGYECFVTRYQNDSLINAVPVQPVQNYLSVYPQPAGDELYFHNAESNFVAEIFDPEGRKILQSTGVNHVDISNLKSGVYFLRLTAANNSIQVVKFIKR